MMPALQPGDRVPHFVVRDVEGREVAYADLWQRRNLLLIAPGDDRADHARVISDFGPHLPEIAEHEATMVITRDPIPGLPGPAVLVADRWGEVQFVAAGEVGRGAPDAADLVEWLRFVRQRCPECEGEAREPPVTLAVAWTVPVATARAERVPAQSSSTGAGP
jgi:hypothetical protein